jgi:hypothetical protein
MAGDAELARLLRMEELLLATVDALQDLCGALTDTMPPVVQQDIAEVRRRLLAAVRNFEAP